MERIERFRNRDHWNFWIFFFFTTNRRITFFTEEIGSRDLVFFCEIEMRDGLWEITR